MEILKKRLTLNKNEYYQTHLNIVNVFLPVKMTPKEIEVLAHFMSLEGSIAEDRFGTSARKLVMQHMNLKPGGLGNYFKTLKEKKFLMENGQKKLEIFSLLYPEPLVQSYQFQLKEIESV
jgi:hypothetical protein